MTPADFENKNLRRRRIRWESRKPTAKNVIVTLWRAFVCKQSTESRPESWRLNFTCHVANRDQKVIRFYKLKVLK